MHRKMLSVSSNLSDWSLLSEPDLKCTANTLFPRDIDFLIQTSIHRSWSWKLKSSGPQCYTEGEGWLVLSYNQIITWVETEFDWSWLRRKQNLWYSLMVCHYQRDTLIFFYHWLHNISQSSVLGHFKKNSLNHKMRYSEKYNSTTFDSSNSYFR